MMYDCVKVPEKTSSTWYVVNQFPRDCRTKDLPLLPSHEQFNSESPLRQAPGDIKNIRVRLILSNDKIIQKVIKNNKSEINKMLRVNPG